MLSTLSHYNSSELHNFSELLFSSPTEVSDLWGGVRLTRESGWEGAEPKPSTQLFRTKHSLSRKHPEAFAQRLVTDLHVMTWEGPAFVWAGLSHGLPNKSALGSHKSLTHSLSRVN